MSTFTLYYVIVLGFFAMTNMILELEIAHTTSFSELQTYIIYFIWTF